MPNLKRYGRQLSKAHRQVAKLPEGPAREAWIEWLCWLVQMIEWQRVGRGVDWRHVALR